MISSSSAKPSFPSFLALGGSLHNTFIPKILPSAATFLPTFPTPMTPRVFPAREILLRTAKCRSKEAIYCITEEELHPGAFFHTILFSSHHKADEASFERRVHSYQRYQGEKLRRRFNAYSYVRLSEAVDSHNLGRGRGKVEDVLKQIRAKSLVVAITSDILFPPSDHQILIDNIPDVEYHLIDSDFGHDGFLVEHKQLNDIILNFLGENND